MKLKGKVAVVTGAGQGIGRGIAEAFADQGADVVINDLTVDSRTDEVLKNIQSKGRRAVVIGGNVSLREDVERLFDQAWDALGPVDILVNNAGIETIVPFIELTDKQWEDVTNTNLKSEWMCSQAFCKRLIAEGRKGAIVNIGSIQAARVLPGRTHYAPSKLAIEAMTRNISAEVGSYGIRVNCIHPGLIETPMIRWVLESPDILPHVVAQISLGRPGLPCEIGSVAAFLASDEAAYVTGQALYVDGGWVGK
ncbi:SDR family NAD(P)-dependent oxidoreductase [Edaphobacter sp. 12200R-103]|jgi:NAD(P)-dependent dehydrogenase (short-subunit alcohol dehydrogenase family)|uniref:SDR family NAD(P)-dependent oxidoreductase n=1 Tax=Edaphobacter sp. 12200R-103 TaxID=2703788 RepID=UPI00138C5CC1|nr:3-oxoacyl-ACP reductase family protein [Edaphobacter sp. 12200R-103]QHS52259.1 3-oxoacyl-ACP reductase FabG [Edaphobacter sp. 12200R-103]